jgi:hypothetical protein
VALFVHLAPETQISKIRRGGIRKRRAAQNFPGGVFAVPVTRDFYISHQWLRELKRQDQCAIAAVYFRIPDDLPVWVGHYGQEHRWMAASEATAVFAVAADALGWEVIIPRRIDAKEIHRVRHMPQVLGWRFSPTAKGKPPICTCKFCTFGEYGAAKLRKRFPRADGS